MVWATASTWRRSAEPSSSGRRTDGDQLELAVVDPFLGIGRKAQPAGRGIAFDDGVESGLMNRYFARLEHLDLAPVHIDADHVVAGIRQAGARDEAHIAGSKDRDAHS